MMDQFSPKTSPRGSRSPSVMGSHGQSEGVNLKLSIALGQKPTIIQKGPFYLMRQEAIPANEITGATNLMQSKNLEHSFLKLTSKKLKDSLSSFLPQLPGIIDIPGSEDNSSLRGLIEKPPVCGKELLPLSSLQMTGFRLHPGPLPEQYRSAVQVQSKKKKKVKKTKHRGGETPASDEIKTEEEREKRKDKKHKKHEKDSEDRKKKKKDKKKKRSKEDKDS